MGVIRSKKKPKQKVSKKSSRTNNKKPTNIKKKPVKKGSTDKKATKSRKIRKRSLRTPEQFLGLDRMLKLLDDPTSKWFILELTEDTFLKEHCALIEKSIYGYFGDKVECFMPLYAEKVNDDIVSFVFFEGYVFIKDSGDANGFVQGFRNEYISGPVVSRGEMQYIYGRKINAFKREMKRKIRYLTPRKGETITPKVGVFENLEGIVISVDRKKYIVTARFKVQSRVVEAPIHVINTQG